MGKNVNRLRADFLPGYKNRHWREDKNNEAKLANQWTIGNTIGYKKEDKQIHGR